MFSTSYDFLNIFSLADFILRTQSIVYTTCKIHASRLLALRVSFQSAVGC